MSLARNPEDRQSSAEEFANELERSLNGYIDSVCPRTQIKGYMLRISRWLDLNPFRNVPIFYLTMIGIILALFGGGVWLGLSIGSSP